MSTLRRVVFVAAIGTVAANCDNQELNGLSPWQKSWGWLGQGYRRCQRSSAGQLPSLAGPVMVVVGPTAGSEGRPREFDAYPVQAYENLPAFALKVADGLDLLPRLLGSFRGLFEQTPRSAGFKLRSDRGAFSLSASLPGYDMSSISRQDRILGVHIVGDKLVVQGQRWMNQLALTFQRSFQLPKAADISKVSAVYKIRDGSLEVVFPVGQSAEQDDEGRNGWKHNPQDGGSHTGLTFGAEFLERSRPSLRGASSIREDLVPLLRQSMDFAESLVDPYVGSMSEGAAGSAPDAATASPALLVQPKSAQPYWRLRTGATDADAGSPSLEVVAPWGTELGSPSGLMVPMFNASMTELPRKPIGQVELPVAVSGSDCSWTGGTSASLDRVLRCALGTDVVKDVQIQFAHEL